MRNCYYEDCIHLNVGFNEHNKCKIRELDNPQEKLWDYDCEYFEPSQTCRRCEYGVRKFYCDEEYDFEEDYGCKLDKSIYTCYTSESQCNHDYQCKNGKFKLSD